MPDYLFGCPVRDKIFLEKERGTLSPVRDDMLAYTIHYLPNLNKSEKTINNEQITNKTEKDNEFVGNFDDHLVLQGGWKVVKKRHKKTPAKGQERMC